MNGFVAWNSRTSLDCRWLCTILKLIACSVVNTSAFQWIGMLKRRTELYAFIPLVTPTHLHPHPPLNHLGLQPGDPGGQRIRVAVRFSRRHCATRESDSESLGYAQRHARKHCRRCAGRPCGAALDTPAVCAAVPEGSGRSQALVSISRVVTAGECSAERSRGLRS